MYRPREGSMFRNSDNNISGSYKGDGINAGSKERFNVNTSYNELHLAEDVRNIENIEVKNYEEIIRNDKKTTVYTIEYIIRGYTFKTKRSYSEFEALKLHVSYIYCIWD